MEKAELNREIGMCALTPSTPMSISGNPIYEPFGPCAELQPIPRANVTLIRLIPFDESLSKNDYFFVTLSKPEEFKETPN